MTSDGVNADETTPLRRDAPPAAATAAAFSVDDAIESVSMGRYQLFLIALTGLAWTAESMEMMLLSFIKQPLQCEWRISDAHAALITTAVGLGMLCGAFFWGRLADRNGRKPAFVLCTAATFAFGIGSAMAPNYAALLTLRALTGFGVGGLPVSFSLLMEMLPASGRGSWGMAVSLFWALGAVFEAAVAMAVLPRFGWRALIVASSMPLLLVLLSSFPLLESPRWLVAHARVDDALAVLRRVAAMQRHSLPDGQLVAHADGDGVETRKATTGDLFVPYVRGITAKVFVLWWAAAFTYYGLVMLQPELLAMENVGARCSYAADECGALHDASRCALDERCDWAGEQAHGCVLFVGHNTASALSARAASTAVTSKMCANRLRTEDFVSSLWGAVGEVPGIMASLLLIDVIGRRPVLAIWFASTALSFLLLIQCTSRHVETLLFFVGRGMSAGAFQAVYLFTNELYPAAVRATAMGVCSGVARTGLMAAPLVAQFLTGLSIKAAMGTFFGVGAAAVVTALAVQVETNGRRMLSGVEEMVELLKGASAV
eukprot:TRINITY_DN3_c0_g1_i2.p2 TRINITY_DN3_c0_g1~~TRINITY_DN3_c0_g1_i2.p2  ORF type:complete len:553 (+),score=116.07 TRINITY_DN3_c0_g1_i2:27-1661(+)